MLYWLFFVKLIIPGLVAEWLRSGLQNRLHRFNSGRDLKEALYELGLVSTLRVQFIMGFFVFSWDYDKIRIVLWILTFVRMTKENMAKKKFIIIDGNALLHRAFHALPPLTTKDGELVNAVYGFTMVLLKVFKELKPDYMAVAFDRAAPTFRHEEYEEYKANRVKAPDELYEQLPLLKRVVEAFNIPIYEKDGYEADDIIGTLCKDTQVDNKHIESIIVTGDLDALQLVDDNTKVYTLKRGISDTIIYDAKAVKERYGGLGPEQMIDYKALRGDPSDNIPGVRGIGEKTATELLNKYGSLDELYDNIERKQIKERIKNLLIEHKDNAYMSRRLATIDTKVPIKFKLEDCEFGYYEKDKVLALFRAFDFRTMLNKLPEVKVKNQGTLFDKPIESKQKEVEENDNYILVDNKEEFEKFFKKLKEQKIFAVDTEATSLDTREARLLGISFSWKDGLAYYVVGENNFKEVKGILEDEKVKKVGHNLKYDMQILSGAGIEMKGVYFDTMVASYLLNPGVRAHKLDDVVFGELGHVMISYEDIVGKGKDKKELEEIELKKVSDYSCEDADYTWRLMDKLEKKLRHENLWELFEGIEMPIVPILAEMEMNGVKIDVDFLIKLSKKAEEDILKLEKKIYKMAGQEFNIKSPIQLKEILFEKLGISTEGLKKTKTGISTAADELEKLRDRHEIIDLISQYRELTKLRSTYLEALPKLVSPKTGRVHTSFNQTITATGRLSSSDPNLQNIPIRTEVGREIRKAFIAEKGYKLIAADYSQIELRIVASIANDKKMIEAFNKGADIHRQTAALVNGVEPKDVTPEMRRAAKSVNFGVIYGMGVLGLARGTGISREEAKKFIEQYFNVYKGIKKYIEETKEKARTEGYVETLFGRKRNIPEIHSGMPQVRSAAERMAINMPIQGTAADIMKLAMIAVKEEVVSEGVKDILQVHDELVLEVRDDLADKVSKKVKKVMEGVCELKVPTVVDVKVGKNWGEMEEK